MPTALEHRASITEAVAALNKALSAAHEDGLAVILFAEDSGHIARDAMGEPTKHVRTPASVALLDVAEFVDEEEE